jgi:nucleoside-diphosphate-sugar epimerase
MQDALIGHTGFVGGNLARQHPFAACFNSANVEEISGRHFGLLVCSAMPAAKWLANREPDKDRATLDRLTSCLRRARAERVVVVSTVDVYPSPLGVDEDTPIDPAAQNPYGRHRHLLELAAREHFPTVAVLRLPALFGPGLKKNAVFDLLHGNEVHKVHADGAFQFYNLDHLWADVQKSLANGLALLNVATEPLSVREVAREAFGMAFDNRPVAPPARYDMRSKHAALFGGRGGYLYGRDQVLKELKEFVDRERVGSS